MWPTWGCSPTTRCQRDGISYEGLAFCVICMLPLIPGNTNIYRSMQYIFIFTYIYIICLFLLVVKLHILYYATPCITYPGCPQPRACCVQVLWMNILFLVREVLPTSGIWTAGVRCDCEFWDLAVLVMVVNIGKNTWEYAYQRSFDSFV